MIASRTIAIEGLDLFYRETGSRGHPTILLLTSFQPKVLILNKRDLQTLEFHLLNTGHFALEDEGEAIAAYR